MHENNVEQYLHLARNLLVPFLINKNVEFLLLQIMVENGQIRKI